MRSGAVATAYLLLLLSCTYAASSPPPTASVWTLSGHRRRSDAPVHSLLVDNYDSYTYNLFQLLSIVNGREPTVIYNDKYASWEEALKDLPPFDNIVISPGPGSPEVPKDIGFVLEMLRDQLKLAKTEPRKCIPVLGVCLGHQAISYAAGGRVVQAPTPMHGRLSQLVHTDMGVFRDVPQRTRIVRYHSLIATNLPKELIPTSYTEDGILMGLQHQTAPIHGVQFHPESICTEAGEQILENFRQLTLRHYRRRPLPSRRHHIVPSVLRTRRHDLGSSQQAGSAGYVAFVHRIPCGGPRERLDELYAALFGSHNKTFWLDSSSAEGSKHGGTSNRFSYMGAVHNATRWSHALEYNGHGQLTLRYGDGRTETRNEPLLDHLRRQIGRGSRVEALDITDVNSPTAHRLPFNFTGGYVGYLSYEMRQETLHGSYEPGEASTEHDAGAAVPLSVFLFADRYLAIDHATNEISIVQIMPAGSTVKDLSGWGEFVQQVTDAVSAISADPVAGAAAAAASTLTRECAPPSDNAKRTSPLHPARDQSQYLADIHQCLDLISQGETYEVCLTNTFTRPAEEEPLHVYRKLRRMNPAPYSAFIRYSAERSGSTESRSLAIACSSPETFLRASPDGVIESRPIKGTSRRGRSSAEDEALTEELLGSEKTQAENLMIVDLVRNDLGRVCHPGSVTVPRLMDIESYATVLQMVSTIRGQLRDDCTPIDAIAACFPGGSMTGAPKKRTMEIIHKLEHEPRGVYSGSLGYISLNGGMDLNIVIRTIVFNGSHASIGCGGAIVAMSDAMQEYEEMVLKANAVSRAFESEAALNPAVR